MKVVLASKNKHKLIEISKITEKFDIELVMESDLVWTSMWRRPEPPLRKILS